MEHPRLSRPLLLAIVTPALAGAPHRLHHPSQVVGRRHQHDSLVAMAWTLQLLADEGRPLSQIGADMPSYAMVKTKFPCASEQAAIILDAVRQEFSRERIDETDGLRIDWPEGWVQIRRSNTEPIIRIIAEAQTESAATELVARIRNVADRT